MTKAYSYLRFSSPEQLKGDSRRRQLESSRVYAERHGLELVEGYADLGISAFKGKNVAEGALGEFLAVAKAGRIERGAYLLIESLDRLSRQEIRKSLALFLSIIDAGINIVTLTDDRVYTVDKELDLADFVTSLVIMSRANEESRTKSMRLSAVWANKRKCASRDKPMTSVAPAWFKFRDGRFEVIEERAHVVRSIFEDSAAGMGIYTICRRLNRDAVEPFGRSGAWSYRYVAKVLCSRAVLGEFTPKGGSPNRLQGAEPIVGYFPRVVDDDLFYRAQAGMRARRRGGGRRGKNVTNLFSRMVRCAYCGSKVKYEYARLVCEGARSGKTSCERVSWNYEELETSFLTFIEELDLEGAMQDRSDRVDHEATVQALVGRREEVVRDRERVFALLEAAGTEFVAAKLRDVEARLVAIGAELREAEDARSRDTNASVDTLEVKELIKRLQSDDAFELRSQVAARLQSLVASIEVAANGAEVGRFFVVTFRSGSTHVIFD